MTITTKHALFYHPYFINFPCALATFWVYTVQLKGNARWFSGIYEHKAKRNKRLWIISDDTFLPYSNPSYAYTPITLSHSITHTQPKTSNPNKCNILCICVISYNFLIYSRSTKAWLAWLCWAERTKRKTFSRVNFTDFKDE